MISCGYGRIVAQDLSFPFQPPLRRDTYSMSQKTEAKWARPKSQAIGATKGNPGD
jgi:hypothetical protein